ncbi:MAG TPA: hypothetical protein VI547_16000, partial [Anaerolineales bacterium]|nr:hypothetical protein [Anaerolineales bacterium]
SRKGVHVLTVKPGMVDTDMLKDVKRRLWVVSAEQVAQDVWKGIKGRKQEIYTPARWRLMMLVIRHIPSFVFRRLSF